MFLVHCFGLQDLNNERAINLVLKLGLIFANFRNKLCLLRNILKYFGINIQFIYYLKILKINYLIIKIY